MWKYQQKQSLAKANEKWILIEKYMNYKSTL